MSQGYCRNHGVYNCLTCRNRYGSAPSNTFGGSSFGNDNAGDISIGTDGDLAFGIGGGLTVEADGDLGFQAGGVSIEFGGDNSPNDDFGGGDF